VSVTFAAEILVDPSADAAAAVLRDWELDPVNADLVLTGTGDASFLSGTPAIVSDLKSRLLTFLGEWYLDLTLGFDWFGSVLGQKLDEGRVRAKVETEALACPGVVSVDSVSATVTDTTHRQVTISFTATTDIGAVISVTLAALQQGS
jgi:hypothetical protein